MPPPMPPQPGQNKSKTAMMVLSGAVLGALIGAVAITIFVVSRSEPEAAGSQDSPTPGATTESGPASDETDPSSDADPSDEPSPASTGPGDVRDLSPGLFCRDLKADSYSYSAAVDYWRMHGQPERMDADLNGIPCETVYPADRVRAYWGSRMPSADAPVYEPPTSDSYLDLPAGLYCRDLYSSGHSYGDALSYWYFWGKPDRMDADLNGIPCETVYPKSTVDLYW